MKGVNKTTNITFDELSTLRLPSGSLQTALDKVAAALGSVGDAGQQARQVVDELRASLQAAAAQGVKSARSLAKFDEINRLSAPAAEKTAASAKEKQARYLGGFLGLPARFFRAVRHSLADGVGGPWRGGEQRLGAALG